MRRLAPAALALAGLAACSGPAETPTPTSAPSPSTSSATAPTASATTPATESAVPETHEFTVLEHERFDEPWALAFLPGTDTMAITER
ncbi:MAG TPA: hypothetical protein VLQ67_07160, partial [Arachnia sp.]|nr:hypothetical protein [Arachnia sp.]